MSDNLVLYGLIQLIIRCRRAEGITYRRRGRGALLSLPRRGLRQGVIQTKLFEGYIRKNVVSWFNWSRGIGLPVDPMEDLVLV